MPPHRRPGAGASPNGRAARLCQRRDTRRLAAFHRLDPERAGARIRPEPERSARRVAEGADPYRARRHDQIAGAAGPRDRARSRRSRALPRRMTGRSLYTIGYEKALLKDVISTLAA